MYQRAKFAVRILCIVLSGALCFLSAACGKTPSSSPESSWDTGTASSSDQSASPSSDQSENPSQSVAVPENQTSSDGSTTGNRPSPSSKNAAPTRGNTPTSRITTASTEAPTSSPTVTTPKEPAMSVLSLTDKAVLAKVKIQGRSGPVSSGVSFDWSANTLEFQAACAGSVSLTLKENASQTLYYTVLVDGKEQKRAHRTGSRLFLAENLPQGDHTFQVVRQTESFYGQATLCAIELTGQLKSRPADRPLYMEFLGDSITVGLGNLCLGLPQPASDYSENQDGTQSYAYLTAQALGADISVLARSGIGAYQGWNSGNPALPPMYESISYYRDKTAPWAFSRQADIVVINLGTNDLWTGGSSSALTQAMQDFMRQVRRKNPRAAIVWAAGGIMADYLDEAADAVNRLGGAAKNYYVCPLPCGPNKGGNGHPTVEQHRSMADSLVAFLRQNRLVSAS